LRVLITGAAGNLGSALARHLAGGPHELRLLIHRKPLPADIAAAQGVAVRSADLGDPVTLGGLCDGVDCVVHFAGVLFAPRPRRFLHRTNVEFVHNLLEEATRAGVGRFILISFPHVVGESTPERAAGETLDGRPQSIHAQTRLEAEKLVFAAGEQGGPTPVVLRAGMVYANGVLMIDAARWLMERRFLGVWRGPTWIHLLSLPDFLACVAAAIEREGVSGVYNIGDDEPTTLQAFLDAAADAWGVPRPWHAPPWLFNMAGALCEAFAIVFRTRSPLTRDFVRIGMASCVGDTSRMRRELLPELAYPRLADGLSLLRAGSTHEPGPR